MPAQLTLSINVDGAEQKFGVLVDSYKDLSPVLKEFDQYKRGKIAELFASGGNGQWPERSQRQERRMELRKVSRIQNAPTALHRKLEGEFRKTRSKRGINAVARRWIVLKEFEARYGPKTERLAGLYGNKTLMPAPEASDEVLAAAEKIKNTKGTKKSVAGLAARFGRAVDRAKNSTKILGSLPETVRSEIKSGVLTIDSSWDSPAPKALQEGGKVGNNAELKPRKWLYWDQSDVEYLKILLRARGQLAWG